MQLETWDINGSTEAVVECGDTFIEIFDSPLRGPTSSTRQAPQPSASSSWDQISESGIVLQLDESDFFLVVGPKPSSSNVVSKSVILQTVFQI